MRYMVIERFKSRDAATAVYERFAERGRMLPPASLHRQLD
jgi:hypothetical protein